MKYKQWPKRDPIKNYFQLPNEIFLLGLSPGALAVYSYLLCCENRNTYQCWPSYRTIGRAVKMSANTVRKYVCELEERQLISTESTTVTTKAGLKRNGNLLYTIRPIQLALDQFYDQQLAQMSVAAERQRVAKALALHGKNYSKPMLRPSSQRSYEDFIRLYIRPKLGSVPLNKLTTNELQQFFNWMRKDGRTLHREFRGGGLSDNMVRNCHSLCRRALEKAVSERLIVKNPIEGCKAPPIRREEMQLLTREELQRLLIQAKDEGYYEVFLLELTTGMRRGELLALQWSDLDFKTELA